MRPDHFGQEPPPVVWDTVRAVCRTQECFADEIAIDFPSVHHLIDRAREGFLGEGREAGILTTDISLTWRDARIGTVVPLDVPVTGACRLCGGRGETWTEPCAGCHGSGNALVRHHVKLRVPAGVSNGARLRFRVTSPHGAVRVEVRIAIGTSS